MDAGTPDLDHGELGLWSGFQGVSARHPAVIHLVVSE
jgi:hypothetical protein